MTAAARSPSASKAPRVVALGEMLLRLKAPGYERLMQTEQLEATFGGAEANVTVALANDGIDAAFVGALPHNALGDAAVAAIRSAGVDTSHVVRREGRLGTYYLETGAGARPGRVLYDRAGSVFSETPNDAYNWDRSFAGASWLHVTGITPAISATAADVCLRAVARARELGLTVSCDYNFRAALWQYGKQPAEVMRDIMQHVNVGISGRGDCQQVLGIQPTTNEPAGALDMDWYRDLAKQVLDTFPSLEQQVITLREGESAGRYQWSGCAHDRRDFVVSKRYDISEVVDRVGAGDAFTAGFIYGRVTGRDLQYAVDFATAASCLKHSIPGDFNRVRAAEVEALMQGGGGGRMKR